MQNSYFNDTVAPGSLEQIFTIYSTASAKKDTTAPAKVPKNGTPDTESNIGIDKRNTDDNGDISRLVIIAMRENSLKKYHVMGRRNILAIKVIIAISNISLADFNINLTGLGILLGYGIFSSISG